LEQFEFRRTRISAYLSDVQAQSIHFVGIAPWRLVVEMPRHNTIHQAIYESGVSTGLSISYLGLKDHEPVTWILRAFPKGILKPFPALKHNEVERVAKVLPFFEKKRKLFYIYEGSFSWMIVLKFLAFRFESAFLVCNLFPASKYEKVMFKNKRMKIRYKFLFRLMSRIGNIQITVDTSHLRDRINANLALEPEVKIFPLPSSFNLLEGNKPECAEHAKVLINVRNFSTAQLEILLSSSCKLCRFVFPDGTFRGSDEAKRVSEFSNVVIEGRSIPVDVYQDYVDTFDYMIFLYEPSLDSSGKILDCITRKVPVCLPLQASEWVLTSRLWNRTFLYNFDDYQSLKPAFNHPEFCNPIRSESPTCTPINTLFTFSNYKLSNKKIILPNSILKALTNANYFIAMLLSKILSLWLKVSKNA
jgi:hypothetical protein